MRVVSAIMLLFLLTTAALTINGEEEEKPMAAMTSAPAQRTAVRVELCPRSQWDPQRNTYAPARVVATMPVRVCTEYDVETETCTEEHDSWSTVVSRISYIPKSIRQYTEMALERYGSNAPDLWEIYHTTDNHTYIEQCLTERDFWPVPESPNDAKDHDAKLIHMAKVWGMTHPHKHLVLRWGYGRLWIVPEHHWNVGERALHTATALEVSTQTDSYYDTHDLRPIHYEESS